MKPVRAKPAPGRARPAGRAALVGLRVPPDFRRRIEAWAASQADRPGLDEAVRRLVELGLGAPPPSGRQSIPIDELNAENDE